MRLRARTSTQFQTKHKLGAIAEYGPFRALLLVGLLLAPMIDGLLADHLRFDLNGGRASAAAQLRERAENGTELHQTAPPSASGAYPQYPLNHTFDGFPQAVGTPPANYQMDDAAYEVGTPPTNYDIETAPVDQGVPTNYTFETGDFTGWTQTGSPSIGSDSSYGYYGKASASGDALTSSAFTVGSSAQVFSFDIKKVTSSSGAARLYVLSGSGYSTSTLLGTFGGSLSTGEWEHLSIDAYAYRGLSIKFKFQRYVQGSWGIDNVFTQQLVPGFSFSGDVYREVVNGDARFRTDDDVTSPAFTVDSAAQHIHFTAKGFGSSQWFVYVRSGSGYSTSTMVLSLYFSSSETTYVIPAEDWIGQSIKLRFEYVFGSATFDDVGAQFVDVPGWTLDRNTSFSWGTTPPLGAKRVAGTNLDEETESTAISLGEEDLISAAFTIDSNAQQLSVRHKGVTSGSTFKIYLLYGSGYASSVSLSGSSAISTSQTVWQTYQYPVGTYAGQSVKIKITTTNRVLLDDIGFTGSVAPGWSPESGYGAIAIGENANGTYVTPFTSAGEMRITSSLVSAGIIDTSSSTDGRSVSLAYAFGSGTGSVGITVWWIPYVGGSPGTACQVYDKVTDGTQTFKDARFILRESCLGTSGGNLVQTGKYKIKVTGGAKVYSIGDNIARQQLGEPFSSNVGGIDTSTGSYGWSTTDLEFAGGGLPLVLARYYSAHSDRLGEMGYRWRHSFDTTLYIGVSQDPVVVLFADGTEEAFEKSGSVYVPTDSRVRSTLTVQPDPGNPSQNQYVYTTLGGKVWTFTDTGLLVTIADTNGNPLSLTYDGSNRLDEVTNGVGTLSFNYDGSGYLTSVDGPGSLSVIYTYAVQGTSSTTPNLVAADLPDDVRQEFGYTRHRLKTVKERQGADSGSAAMITVVSNTIDNYNRITQQRDAKSHYIQLEYGYDGTTPTAGINQIRDKKNTSALTRYYFDHFGRTEGIASPTGEVSLFLFDGAGNLESFVDGSGGEYAFGYNSSGDVTGITDPLNHSTNIVVNAAHLPVEIVDDTGIMTVHTYDGNGNRTRTVVDASEDSQGTPNAGTGFLDLTTEWTFDGDGNMTSMTIDPGGEDLMTRFVYDDGLLVQKIDDPQYDADNVLRSGTRLSLTTEYTYNTQGQLTSETDPDSVMTRYDYSGHGRLVTSVLDPELDASFANRAGDHLDLTSEYGYDVPGNLITVKDRVCFALGGSGCLTEWTYDESNLPTDKTDNAGVKSRYEYDENGLMTSYVVDPDDSGTSYDGINLESEYLYDDSGRLEFAVTDPDGFNLITQYVYDEAGRLSEEIVDPDRVSYTGLKLTTSYSYDGDLLATKTQPDGGVWSYLYDSLGRLEYVVDPEDHVTQTVYDRAGRVIQTIVDPSDPGTSYVGLDLTTTTIYNDANQIIQSIDAEGIATLFGYDDAGRMISVIVDPDVASPSYDGLNLESQATYTLASRIDTVTDPAGYVTDYDYDSAGRLSSVTEPGNRITAYEHDENGQVTLVRIMDETGTATLAAMAIEYDVMGRQTATIVDPDAPSYIGEKFTSAYTYDKAGRLDTSTDPELNVTDYDFDTAGRLDSVKDAASTPGVLEFTYDAASRMTSLENARGKVTVFTHDEMGRVATSIDPLSRVHAYTYNGLGQLATHDDANGNELTYEYDAANRLSRIYDANTYGTFGNYVTYGYDAVGRATAVTNANGAVGYDYDAAGRMVSQSSPQGTVGYAYNDAGQRTEMTLPSVGSGPRVVTYDYDAGSGDLAEITDWTGGDPIEFDFTAARQIEEIRRPNGVTSYYGYDAALRLTGITHSDGISALAEFGYEYDANGNRTRLDVTGTEVANGYELYGYDELNRLDYVRYPDASEVAYGYDPNGNLTIISPVGGSTITYGYDDADQLQTIDTVDHFEYDSNGNRISRDTDTYTWDWSNRLTQAEVGGTTVEFDYLGDNTRAVKTVDTPSTTEYLWDRASGLPLLLGDGTTSVVHAGGGATEVDDATDDRLFALTDGLGSVRAQSDDAGTVTGAADYDVWGAEIASTTSSLFSWTGEQNDDETGLTYLRARYYSPTYSRFLSVDPIQPNAGGTQGFNAYAYAQNNPATLTDPSGMLAVRDLPGFDGLSKASQSGFLRHMARIKCLLIGGGIGCIDLLEAGRAVQQFGEDHPCTDQCKNIVKWAPIIIIAAVVVGIILTACFPHCMMMMMGAAATPQAGVAATTAGALATRGPQIQTWLRAISQHFGRTQTAARAPQILANQRAVNLASNAEHKFYLIYQYIDKSGIVRYIGRTSNFSQRAAWWASVRRWRIEPIEGLGNLTLKEARGVEQWLIEYHGLNGVAMRFGQTGTLYNRINSIARSSPMYDEAIEAAKLILGAAGYEV